MSIIKDDADKVNFTTHYKQEVFLVWYNSGKINSTSLYNTIQEEEISGKKPTRSTLQRWINEDFVPQAQSMDDEVIKSVRDTAISEKIKMLERHTQISERMQDIAMTYLEHCEDELNPNSAVRMLIEGIRIERESRGLPEALRKLSETSDEDLVRDIQKLISDGSSTIEPLLSEDIIDASS